MESSVTKIGPERITTRTDVQEGRSGGGGKLHYILGVAFLGMAALITVGGSIFLESNGVSTPDLLATVSGGAIGALAGLLVNPKEK
jgi:hypothetical protein